MQSPALKLSLLALSVSFQVISASAQCYELIWSEEFDYSGHPDPNIWTEEVGGWGWGNSELQYYKANDLDNAKVEDGLLKITALKESYEDRKYTSARLISKGKFSFQYGKIEARIKLPYGQGIWPAFWMMGENFDEAGWPYCGEIDIMEMIGGGEGRDDKVYGTIHWDNNDIHAHAGGDTQLETGIFANDFHTFSIEWTSKVIVWYLDGEQYHVADIQSSDKSEFHEEFFILLNVAVGGEWPGNPIPSTVFPQQMQVDYIRVYKNSKDYETLEIEGGNTLPQNSHNTAFSLPEIEGWDYQWTVPEDVSVLSGQGTNTVHLDWGCTSGTIKSEYTGNCKTYTFEKIIELNTEIMGPDFIGEYEKSVKYYVPPMHGTQYTWTVPEDAEIVSGKNNDTMIVNWGSTFAPVQLELVSSCGTLELEHSSVLKRQYPYPDMITAHNVPGTISAVDFDFGGQEYAYVDNTPGNSGNGPRQDEDVDTEYAENGDSYVGSIAKGEYLEYTVNVESASTYQADMNVATAVSSAGPFNISFNGEVFLKDIFISNTGGWENFATVNLGTVYLTESDSILGIEFRQGGLNFSSISFSKLTSSELQGDQEPGAIEIFPVPARDRLSIHGLHHPSSVRIYDMNGRELFHYPSLSPQNVYINISDFENGVYFMKIENGSELHGIKKFIKIS